MITDYPKIRRAQSHEGELLSNIAFRSKAYWGYSTEFMEACRDELTYISEDLRPGLFFVICDDAIPVGFYGLSKVSESVFELEALFVEPDRIGQGFGRQLIEHAKVTAKHFGAKELLIQGDPNASAFYRKAGVQRVGERESDSIPGRFLPVFSVQLDN